MLSSVSASTFELCCMANQAMNPTPLGAKLMGVALDLWSSNFRAGRSAVLGNVWPKLV